MAESVNQKVAVVTGGSGIGEALCVGLAHRGTQVVVADINGEDADALRDKLPFPVHSKVILTRDGVVLSFVPSFHSVQPCELL
jgi:NAD(P)-dependent dehydrogenase (short-subunit alcohol dehydrogenase family)